ncbi:MAG: citrate/2-methylcitrate synthase [Exilibacterium sp.]
MADFANREYIYSTFWDEQGEASDPFSAAHCYCCGYDVYGELITKVSWIEYLYLLFLKQKPHPHQTRLLERLAIALANPGPRAHSVAAAMSAGAGGSTMASCLMSALAVGAGNLGGAREVMHMIQIWHNCKTDLDRWREVVKTHAADNVDQTSEDVWLLLEHVPGFNPNAGICPTVVKQTLHHLAESSDKSSDNGYLIWLHQMRTELETIVGYPLSLAGVAACALAELELEPETGEMLYLLLRLPGAAAHALEQRKYGWKQYPFFNGGLELQKTPDAYSEG